MALLSCKLLLLALLMMMTTTPRATDAASRSKLGSIAPSKFKLGIN